MKTKNVNLSDKEAQQVKPSGLSVVDNFLWESNAIESEWSWKAFQDAKKAWAYAISLKKMSVYDVLKIHKILMKRLRPDIAGELRMCDVMIGGEIKRFFSTDLLMHMIINCLVRMREKRDFMNREDMEQHSRDMHVAFENIHPFEDGNGRTGRILYNWHRKQLGLPIHVIHADWPLEDGEQRNYYGWFK